MQPITDEMFLEHVVMAHPTTEEIFHAFGIDCAADGGRCLKELNGLRGVDTDALLLALNQSLDIHGGAAPIPSLLWNSCDGMMVIDGSRRILAMNPALERLLGRRTPEVAGRRECGLLVACRDLHGCALSDHPAACPGLRAMRRARAVKVAEYSIQTATRRRTWISASYTPIQPSFAGPVWALVVMRDIALQKRRERRMVRQAISDPLTGLVNRAGFLEACSKELSRATRHGRALAVAMADLDGFKAYNDTYGHLAGDELLRGLAQVLRSGLRASELVARYGGDEFVLLLPETDAEGASDVATRLEQLVARFPFARPPLESPTHPMPITISIGVAVFPGDGQTTEALLAQADRRLYEAKRGH